MQMCGIDLENSCFSHGQLYVASSLVGKSQDLFIYAENGETKNISCKLFFDIFHISNTIYLNVSSILVHSC